MPTITPQRVQHTSAKPKRCTKHNTVTEIRVAHAHCYANAHVTKTKPLKTTQLRSTRFNITCKQGCCTVCTTHLSTHVSEQHSLTILTDTFSTDHDPPGPDLRAPCPSQLWRLSERPASFEGPVCSCHKIFWSSISFSASSFTISKVAMKQPDSPLRSEF